MKDIINCGRTSVLVFAIGLIASQCHQVSAADQYAEYKLDSVRAKMLKTYDADKNGRLDPEERENMRLARWRKGEQSGRQRRDFQPPKEWLERYDDNEDGELSRDEMRIGFEKEKIRISKLYDKNSNDKLDDEEKNAIKRDLEERKFEGIDAFVAMQLSGAFRGRGGRERGGSAPVSREQKWLDFDTDGDGRASAKELAMIRKHEQQTQTKVKK